MTALSQTPRPLENDAPPPEGTALPEGPAPPEGSAPPEGPVAARRGRSPAWMSVDLGALALALDGARPLPAGSARLVPWGAPIAAPRRVPASALVVVRRRAAPPPAPALRPRRPRAPLARSRPARAAPLPRRHKLMLAAAAVVMTLGFLGAGADRTRPVTDAVRTAAVPSAG